ncbi:ImmA/IrrE family metallo-endopeptidase [Mycolicibacterium phlei]|uniref:ImmA/IrrE family metallo-endopeptidase n=1 Tax=Mycolicibacterium phlei TaxID=1771 RepID=UPI0037CB61A7
MWRDEAKYKNLGATSSAEQGILTSFGMAVGKALIAVAPRPNAALPKSPEVLRLAILRTRQYVGLAELLSFCWAAGIVVAQLEVFPLSAKRMHAMTVRVGDRYAILLGTRLSYPAQASFIVAHELGHIAEGHLGSSAALLDVESPLELSHRDDEEDAADKYALSLLTGFADPRVMADTSEYIAAQVADAAVREAPRARIEPGTLALCLAFSTGNWKQSVGALKMIYGDQPSGAVGAYVNRIAKSQLDLSNVTDRTRYIEKILKLDAVK